MARITISGLALALAAATTLRAQQPPPSPRPDPRYGVYSDLNWNFHSASFRALPGVPNCCQQFESGSGAGGTFGLLYEYPLSDRWWLGLRAGYSSLGATLAATEHTTVILDMGTEDAEIEHSITSGIATIGLEPMAIFKPVGGLSLHLGGRLGYVLSTSFSQRETLKRPEDRGTFTNGRRTRNDTSGTIPNASAISGALLIGLSNELRLNSAGTLWAVPEVFLALGLTPVMGDSIWRASSLRLGVALKYGPRSTMSEPVAEIPSEPPVPPPSGAPTRPTPAPSVAIDAVSLDRDGRELPSVRLRVEEFISTYMRPLLNYIFFDEGSSAIPDRYARMTPEETARFSVDALHGVEVLPTYYQILNVVGARMREHPEATIRIVGCNADVGAEKGNEDLSRRRAVEVREYLASVWKIDPARLRVETRGLPEKASNEAEADGVAENRRVEIQSDSWKILEPIVTSDTLRMVTPPVVRFRPTAAAEAGVASWRLEARQGDRTLKAIAGESAPPATVDWDVASDRASIPGASDPVVYTLTVTDRAGRSTTTPVAALPVEQITISRKRREQIADRMIDRYSLILFDYDRSELNPANHRIADLIKGRISDRATTTIIGYTDRIGDADYNLRLSEARARAIASALGLPSARVRGVGESQLYPNDLPEGRFYCRTVTIVAETPVGEKP